MMEVANKPAMLGRKMLKVTQLSMLFMDAIQKAEKGPINERANAVHDAVHRKDKRKERSVAI